MTKMNPKPFDYHRARKRWSIWERFWIGLKEEWKPQMVTRIIYIGDLVNRPPDFPAPRLGLKGVTRDDD